MDHRQAKRPPVLTGTPPAKRSRELDERIEAFAMDLKRDFPTKDHRYVVNGEDVDVVGYVHGNLFRVTATAFRDQRKARRKQAKTKRYSTKGNRSSETSAPDATSPDLAMQTTSTLRPSLLHWCGVHHHFSDT
eukprot:TRINITY_DN3588_c0_g1_i1.p1 TRINITY_DN3588_c0_g1~~TRINITY_DN3588_c0_g1_i1.p1  ORF type:complete len:133 (+),score=30.15 TRINITY_DN3588_c0_g1_i1:95-493(+)